MDLGTLLYMKQSCTCVFTVFAQIDSISNEGLHLKILNLCIDGYGAMWPVISESALNYGDGVRIPNDEIQKHFKTREEFDATWVVHTSCKDPEVFFDNVRCRCVSDAVEYGTHIPTYISRDR